MSSRSVVEKGSSSWSSHAERLGSAALDAVRLCAVSGLYPRRHANFAKAVTATIPSDALPVGAETIRVTPLDSYGNRGRALEAKIGGQHG